MMGIRNAIDEVLVALKSYNEQPPFTVRMSYANAARLAHELGHELRSSATSFIYNGCDVIIDDTIAGIQVVGAQVANVQAQHKHVWVESIMPYAPVTARRTCSICGARQRRETYMEDGCMKYRWSDE